MPSPELKTSHLSRMLWSIVGFSVLARLAAAAYLGNAVTPQPGVFDELSYHTLALRVLEGHGFSFGTGWWPATAANEPTAHWSYLYVLLLSGFYWLAGPNPLVVRLIQAGVCGILQPLLTYAVARRLFGPRVGLASAAVAAGYAYFIYYSGALVTESLYMVAILWAIHVALGLAESAANARPVPLAGWLQLGAALAVAVLLRQVMLLVVPVIVLWAGWRVARPSGHATQLPGRSSILAGMAASVAIVVLCIAPWTVRNYRAFHQFVPLNTNAGFALFWGNHPTHGTSFVPILPGAEYGALIPKELDGLNEAALDRALLQRAVGFVSDDPVRYLLLSLSRVKEYMKFWPSEESGRLSNLARVLSFGICLPFLVWGCVLVWRQAVGPLSPEARAGVGLLAGIAVVYSLIHLLTWTLVRYRLPIDAVLMPFIGLSMVYACDVLYRWAAPLPGSPRMTRVSG